MPGVSPTKSHLLVGERDEAVVGDSDAVCIAAEVPQRVLGAAKRPLGIDDLLLAERLPEQ
jgi:hypothetical protein